jgi:hypothetical protein
MSSARMMIAVVVVLVHACMLTNKGAGCQVGWTKAADEATAPL